MRSETHPDLRRKEAVVEVVPQDVRAEAPLHPAQPSVSVKCRKKAARSPAATLGARSLCGATLGARRRTAALLSAAAWQ
jgi:hypothetical protein